MASFFFSSSVTASTPLKMFSNGSGFMGFYFYNLPYFFHSIVYFHRNRIGGNTQHLGDFRRRQLVNITPNDNLPIFFVQVIQGFYNLLNFKIIYYTALQLYRRTETSFSFTSSNTSAVFLRLLSIIKFTATLYKKAFRFLISLPSAIYFQVLMKVSWVKSSAKSLLYTLK